MENNEQTGIKQSENQLSLPIAIIVAGALIAGAVYIGMKQAPAQTASVENNPAMASGPQNANPAPITEKDHILGNPSATIKIVEYSDLECPFCKGFHATMHQIMDIYGKDGKVAWVYRHFPLDEIHPKAREEAAASECAAELGGNDAFWKFIDKVFSVTPSNNKLDLALLPNFAEEIGINKAVFETCFSSGKYQKTMDAARQEAFRIGIKGTPYSVIVTKDKIIPIEGGAVPFDALKFIIDPLVK